MTRASFCSPAAFHDLDRIAAFGDRESEHLLRDEGIVRHRGKIEAVINNARRAQESVAQEGSLAAFFWRYETAMDTRTETQTVSTSETSRTLSKRPKKMGWKFVGPTTVYAFLQAMGLVNDPALNCVIRSEVERARARFTPPT